MAANGWYNLGEITRYIPGEIYWYILGRKLTYGEARVIPIILKPVDWMGAPFAKLQALPKDAKPVTSWADQDEAFANVARGIRKAIESLNEGKDNRFLSFMKKFRGLVGVIVASIALIGVIFNLFAVQDQNEILRSIQSIFISPTFTSTITDTPTFTNTPSNTPTSSITPVTPSPTIKRSDTPTTKPTDTPTPTPITPTDTSTVNPYLSRGLNSGCFDETHWWSNAELNILNGKCLDVTSWFILPEPNQLRIFVNDDKLTQNVNRYLVTEIGKKSIINFIVKLDKLNTLDSTQDAYLAFGVGTPDRSAQRSGGAGEFLVFHKYYESNPYDDIYLEFGSGIYGVQLHNQKIYEIGSEVTVRLEVNSTFISVYLNNELFSETTIEDVDLYFWILYNLPANGGELMATITELWIDNY